MRRHDLSIYASENYWQGVGVSVRRLTLRIDGFVSLRAPPAGGELVTKPLVFDGGNLTLNMSTSGAGSVQVEIQDAAGQPVPGYALADCPEGFGDELARVVRWRQGGESGRSPASRSGSGSCCKDADLYAFQFVPYQPDPVRPQP